MSRGFRYTGSRTDLLLNVEIARACERFGKLPSEVMAEDAYLLRRTMAILDELDRIRAMRGGAIAGGKKNYGRGKDPHSR